MTDRDMLLLAYGAITVSDGQNLETVQKLLAGHLFPPTEKTVMKLSMEEETDLFKPLPRPDFYGPGLIK